MLPAQKSRTGLAIFGHPEPPLLADLKLKGETLKDSIAVGEQLALSALQSELYILKIAQIPENRYRKYIGRSQFPLFFRGANSHVTSTPPQYKFELLHRSDTAYSLVSTLKETHHLANEATVSL